MSLNVLCQKIMNVTETSKMKTTGTKTQGAMKQRGTGLLSSILGNSKINGKEPQVYIFLVYIFAITSSSCLIKYIYN